MRLILLILLFPLFAQGQIIRANRFYTLTNTTFTQWYRTVTVDHTKVPNTDQTDFPVLFSGTYSYLKTIGNGGKVNDAQGDDIVFSTDNAGSSKLSWELTYYDPTTGTIEAWIKIPTLTTASDYVFYLGYGNTAYSTFQGGSLGAAWNSAFLGVYHFPDGSSLSVADATANANDGTATNSPTATTGQIDGAMAVTGGSYSALPFGRNTLPFTYSAWVKPSGTTGYRAIFGVNASGGVEIRVDATANTISFLQENTANIKTTTGTLSSGVWSFVTVTVDGSNNVKIYINNASAETATLSGSFAATNTRIGSSNNLEHFAGSIDEARISNVVRGADWVTTEYNNQSNPGTFYSIGAEGSA